MNKDLKEAIEGITPSAKVRAVLPLNLELTEDEVADLISNPDKRVTFIFDLPNLLKHANEHGICIQVINHNSIHSNSN
tara:strand:+ start:382 stop:615 length:234 start_codon:yes stop_codon:yes gene_type:complete